jgi:hypothetical protein
MDKWSLRQYSKEFSRDERKEVAEEVREERSARFSHVGELERRLDDLLERVEQKKIDADEARQEIQACEEELQSVESAFLAKLLGFVNLEHPHVKKLKARVRRHEVTAGELNSQYEELQDTIRSLQEQKDIREDIPRTRERISQFYSNQKEEFGDWYREQLEVRDVKNVIRNHDVLFVHGILPDYVPDVNSLLHNGVNWKTKLEILLTLEPDIATSTIKSGDSESSFWSWIGVILRDGMVQYASPSDAATRAEAIKGREIWGRGGIKQMEAIRGDIGRAVMTFGNKYNELGVRNPKVSGFYFNPERYWSLSPERRRTAPLNEVDAFCREIGMPIYIIERGVAYEARYDEEKKVFIRTSDVPIVAENMIDREFTPSEEDRRQLLENVSEAFPFKLKNPEVVYIEAMREGRRKYIELLGLYHPDQLAGLGEEVVYSKEELGWMGKMEDGATVRRVAVFESERVKQEYFLGDEKLYQRDDRGELEFGRGRDVITRSSENVANYQNGALTGTYMHISYYKFDHPVRRVEDFLSAFRKKSLERVMVDLKTEDYRRRAISEKVADDLERILRSDVKKISFFFYGLGEQAGELGDVAIRDMAFKIANEGVSEKEYQRVVERRLGPNRNGKMQLSKEDLEQLGA